MGARHRSCSRRSGASGGVRGPHHAGAHLFLTLAHPGDAMRTRTRYAAIVGGWTVVALVSTSQWYFFRLSSGHPAPWLPALLDNAASCWLWAGFTPVIAWLARHYRLERGLWWPNAARHALLGLGFAALDVAADVAMSPWISHGPRLSPLSAFFGKSFLNLFSYGAVVAITYAVEYHALFVERRIAAARLEKELLAARLHALESQLRPHFLFNTLHTVASLVRGRRNADAVRTIAALSDLLRSALRRDSTSEIPLREELAFVRRYLDIEQIRFEDRLDTRIVAEPETLDALVPSLILQPLVENAIRHGVERRAAPGRVLVEASRQRGALVLRVQNSSAGIPLAPGGQAGHGIGLHTTRVRLRHLYGTRQRCELTLTAEGGTVALVELPYHRTAPHAASAPPDHAAAASAGR